MLVSGGWVLAAGTSCNARVASGATVSVGGAVITITGALSGVTVGSFGTDSHPTAASSIISHKCFTIFLITTQGGSVCETS